MTEITQINKVYLASKSSVKSLAVQRVFETWEIVEISSESKVSEQPFGKDEIKQGAENRLSCVQGIPAVSIESGVFKEGNNWVDGACILLRTNLGILEAWTDTVIVPENHIVDFLNGDLQGTVGKLIDPENSGDWHLSMYGVSRSVFISNTLKDLVNKWKLRLENIPEILAKCVSYKNVDFLDIQEPLMKNSCNLQTVVRRLADNLLFNAVVTLDSRGFLLCGEFMRENYPIILARKSGKLPGDTVSLEYKKEYGTDTVCIQRGLITEKSRVLVIDDLVATGGTMHAVGDLVERCGGQVVAYISPYLIHENGKPICSENILKKLRYAYTQDEAAGRISCMKNRLPEVSTKFSSVVICPPSLMSMCRGLRIVPVNWGKFSRASNIWADFSMVKGEDVDVYLDPSNYTETSDILSILSILYRKNPASIRVVIPFLEQSTQDRIEEKEEKGKNMECIAEVDTIAKKLGTHKCITLDIHCKQSVFAFHDLQSKSIIRALWLKFKSENQNVHLVFPDDGANKRFTAELKTKGDVTFGKKRGAGDVRILHTDDEIYSGEDYVIVDDLVRSGGTMKAACEYLKNFGARKVYALFAHAPLESNAASNLEIFDDIWTTDSCPLTVPEKWVKIRVCDFLENEKDLD